MTTEFVKTLLVTFLNFPEDVNVIDWTFNAGTLLVKTEDEDGQISVFEIVGTWKGFAATLNVGDFTVVNINEDDEAHCFEG